VFILYKPVLWIHIFFGFLYMLSHGASAAAAYRLRHEKNLDRIGALLDLSGSSFGIMYLSLLAMTLGGVALGFLGRWWSAGWILASLILLIAILVVMAVVASRYFHRVRKAAGLPYREGNRDLPATSPAPPEELAQLLRSGKPHLMTAVGVGGWAIVLWLMIFKPF
jgi:uncharacterized membrane protein YbhN (UPF0104 family)